MDEISPKSPVSRPPSPDDDTPHAALQGRRLAFVGKLAGMSRREAAALAREQGAVVCDRLTPHVDLLVIGEGELPLPDDADPDLWLDEPRRKAFEAGELQIITETQLWQSLRLVDDQHDLRRLYTPAMLADMLGVPLAVIRRWRRLGLIVPVREVRHLPYFDFREAATARRLAQLLASGMSPQTLQRRLAALARWVPDVKRPLAQLSVLVEGRHILLRQGDGWVEPGGQLHFDFEAADRRAEEQGRVVAEQPAPLSPDEKAMAEPRRAEPAFQMAALRATLPQDEERQPPAADQPPELPDPTDPVALRRWAAHLEDLGHLEPAIEMYRASLAAGGPDPRACFAMAEIFYRLKDLSAARERYYMAIELDEHFVEARANLGCVLEEQGQLDLAVAAFQGALACHEDYADVHYLLARTLDRLDRRPEAEPHYRRFLELAPESPWVQHVRTRLG